MQSSYISADVPFRTLRALGGAVKDALLPGAGVNTASMHEGDFLDLFTPNTVTGSSSLIVMRHLIINILVVIRCN